MTRRLLPAFLAAVVLAACGGGADPAASGATSPGDDPLPCDLLTEDQAAAVLDVPAVTEEGLVGDPANGAQASCTWTAEDGAAIDVIVEGPAFFLSGAAPYPDAGAGYDFWREDTLEAGFPVIDLEGIGDAAFTPAFGAEPANSLVMLRANSLVQMTMLGPAGEARLSEAARLVAAALDAAGG